MKSDRGYQVISEDNQTKQPYRNLTAVGVILSGTIHAKQSLASAICARFKMSKVRFTNSGTEANLLALAAARPCKDKAVVSLQRRNS
ncbi:Pyridoxal phosphate-dependent transferase, major region, subdomain 1 [Metarhizium rileyi]|uniref:Pyridoxal phosphate-dependent transferase, major region, subdomain 1 n=1 Tax=Metarhizium rileyi (strain RCEF 4871) TaxID=1649241 RepID=A0A162JUP5_METRR|nr:Pyridoxal phosphate-dependent transferase, major region, subdomain 1 [Metarhizium rileyi RCEF 4871]